MPPKTRRYMLVISYLMNVLSIFYQNPPCELSINCAAHGLLLPNAMSKFAGYHHTADILCAINALRFSPLHGINELSSFYCFAAKYAVANLTIQQYPINVLLIRYQRAITIIFAG